MHARPLLSSPSCAFNSLLLLPSHLISSSHSVFRGDGEMGELSRLARSPLSPDGHCTRSLSLFRSCNAAPAVCSPSRSPLPSSSPPRTTRSVTRERQETNGGPRRRSPFTRHSPHDGRPPPSLPPFHGGGQRQRDSRRGQRSEGSAARGLPACQGRRRLPGRIGAAARPWATSVCFGIWGQSHKLGGAALSLSRSPFELERRSERGSGQPGICSRHARSCIHRP